MSTRYQMLRGAVVNLAAPADAQAAYLDRIFVQCTGGGSAAAYGNDELALELDDIFMANGHMMEFGEITPDEVAAIQFLNDLVADYWQGDDTSFWSREALFVDPRWIEVRTEATRVLRQLPDELRESDYTRGLASDEVVQPPAGSALRSAISKLRELLSPRLK